MKSNKKNKSIKPYLFILPAYIALGAFIFIPLLYTFYLSFFEWNMIKPTKTFVGFDNYIAIFQKPEYFKVFMNTLVYIVLLLIINFVIAYIFAYTLEFLIKKFKDFYTKLMFVPSLMSLVVASLLFLWILNPVSGPISQILSKVGISIPSWSKTEGLVIVVLTIITSWKMFGYNLILLLAGVGGISREVIEAAKMDNISSFHIFKDIVLPMSSATGVYVLIITIIQGLQHLFTPINTITLGGPNYGSSSLIYQAYEEGFRLYKTGLSSSFAIITIVLFSVLLFLEFKFLERRVYYEN